MMEKNLVEFRSDEKNKNWIDQQNLRQISPIGQGRHRVFGSASVVVSN